MKRAFLLLAVVWLMVGLAGRAWGQTTGPATRPAAVGAGELAKMVAPFLDEQTLLVGYADLARVDVGAVKAAALQVAAAAKLGEDERKMIEAGSTAANAWLKHVAEAKVRHVFVVFSMAELALTRRDNPFFFVMPLAGDAEQGTEDAVKKLLPPEMDFQTMVLHGCVVVGNKEQLARLPALQSVARPEVEKALAVEPEAAVRVAVVPPGYFRKVIEDVMPTLPEQAGGGASTALTRGVMWATAWMETGREVAAGVRIESATAADARGADKALGALFDWLTRQPELKQEMAETLPGIGLEELLKVLRPEVKGSGLELRLTQERMVGLAAKVVAPMLAQARENARRAAEMAKMYRVMMGCVMYAEGHGGQWPESLEEVLKAKGITEQDLVNPRAPEGKPGFVYRRPTAEQMKSAASETVVLYENLTPAEAAKGGSAGFADGHVVYMPGKFFEDAVRNAGGAGTQPAGAGGGK